MTMHYHCHVDRAFCASFWIENEYKIALALHVLGVYLVQVRVPGDVIASLFSDNAFGTHARVTDPHCPYKSGRNTWLAGENPA